MSGLVTLVEGAVLLQGELRFGVPKCFRDIVLELLYFVASVGAFSRHTGFEGLFNHAGACVPAGPCNDELAVGDLVAVLLFLLLL